MDGGIVTGHGDRLIDQLVLEVSRKRRPVEQYGSAKAFQRLKDLEKAGGMTRALLSGFAERWLARSRRERDRRIAKDVKHFAGKARYRPLAAKKEKFVLALAKNSRIPNYAKARLEIGRAHV